MRRYYYPTLQEQIEEELRKADERAAALIRVGTQASKFMERGEKKADAACITN